MKRISKKQKWGPLLIVLLLLCLVGVVAADTYVGGLPLTTAAGHSGTVSGGVYMDADNDWWPVSPGVQEVEKEFNTIPNVNNIAWARLYVAVYNGHMQTAYPGAVEIEFDGDGDADFDDLSTSETLNVPFVFVTNGGNDNSGFSGHGPNESYKMVNEHCIRVTSDYVMWYNIDPADITSTQPMAHVTTSGASIDGRIKLITLVVAYNDGDTDEVHYWVNQGQDAVTYYGDSEIPGEGPRTGSTLFDLSDIDSVESATLMVNHMASSDGYYYWIGDQLDRPADTYSQGAYFGWDTWDMTSKVSSGENNDLMYDRSCEGGSGEYSGQFYKIPLAILTVTEEPSVTAPVAAFSATPTSGTSPLSVTFTDQSTNTPTSWTWYSRINGTETWTLFTQSSNQNPIQSFTTGTYDIRLTATNSGGSDDEIKTSYITVTSAPVMPVANFTTNITQGYSGYTPVAVQFNDTSTGPPMSWNWKYRFKASGGTSWSTWTTFATTQNPAYTFTGTGSYYFQLTATNSVGSHTVTKGSTSSPYLIVNPAPLPDLDIIGMRSADSAGVSVFAKETNWVKVTVKNIGGSATTATTLTLMPSDGSTLTETLPVLAAGAETTITFTDPAVRPTAGASVTYTATADAAGTVTESDETNNGAVSTYTVVYNGYKGKKAYWEGGSDVTTKKTFDLHGGLLHSFGDSIYQGGSTSGGGWSAYDAGWTSGNLPVPSGATVKAAWLYVPYTWDNTHEIPDRFDITFNTHDITGTQESHYEDESNFGGYIHHDYGLLAYNVTDFFSTAGNTAHLSKDNAATKVAMYGLTLAVVYEKAEEPRRQVFLNEEFDLLGASEGDYGTSEEEATAYVPFTGLSLNPANVVTAELTTFVPSGNMFEGDLLHNGAVIASDVWDYGASSGPQVAVDTRNIKTYITSSDNVVGIRSTAGATPCMAAAQQFLVLTLTDDVPVANFEADSTTGTTTAPIQFTDTSAGTITVRVWDFGDNNSFYSTTETVIPHTYTSAGTYDVKLTVTGPGGSDEELKEEFITITEGVLAPVAAFTANKNSGLASLSVTFTDQSTNSPTSWKWECRNYNTDWVTFSTAQNATVDFNTPGTYDIRLNATNTGGSGVATKTHFLAVSGGREPLTTVKIGTVTGNLSVQSYGLWSAMESTKSFTLPAAAIGNIQWARLYVNTYGGSAAYGYGHQSTVEFDGNGDGDYLDAGESLGVEICDIASETNGNSYPLNDHITKVFSDYEAQYDVTSLITATSMSARVKSEAISGKTLDGRQKTITLVVAYNDPSSTTQTKYWVNHGQDWFDADYGGDTGSTTFTTSSLEAGFDSATGKDLCTSSTEGTYTFNGEPQSTVTPDPTYFAFHIWDLKDEITAGTDSTLEFGRGSGAASFKTTLATLAVGYETEEPAPIIDFTGTPVSGPRPLTVVFDATNTGGAVNSWKWEHSTNGVDWTQFAIVEDPAYEFTAEGTYDIRLTASGPDNTDIKTRDHYIEVGTATIDVSVSSGSISFGTMQAGVNATGQTQVTVTTNGGNAWSVTASDGKTTNKGFMVSGTTPLASAFQLSNTGPTGIFQAMTADFTGFVSGSGAGTTNKDADVKQAIATGDQPGDYTITITFTGGFS